MNPQQQNKYTFYALGILALAFVFGVGTFVGKHSVNSRVVVSHPATESSIVSDAQFAPFWKAWRILDDRYVEAASTTVQQKIYGAIKGLAASTNDPYTVFFPPEEASMFKDDITGNFGGVGMEIGLKEGDLIVVSPIKDSPAYRADIRSGDRIIKIDDTVVTDFTVEKAVKMIRGEKGTKVTITFIREGVLTPIEKTITRDTINVPTIETELKQGVFIIRLFSFTATSQDLFRGALREFIQSGSDKLVIDLRGNPGGYLDSAWDIASWFLPAGKVIVTEDFGGRSENVVFRSKGYDIFTDRLRLAILVNAGSASASEILAGALREHGVAKLVGTKTFGKGSVQELIPLTADTSLKVTIARWLTPKGHNLSHDGLVPDVEVKLEEKDLTAKKDPQLEKAIEILNK